jgi:hypothetical protein
MDLRKYRPNSHQIQSLLGNGCYQPFIFSDFFLSGCCYSWVTGDLIFAMDKGNDIAYQWQSAHVPLKPLKNYITQENWELFVDCNNRLRDMYDSWIEFTLRKINQPSNYSVIDTASNAGYFLYKFKERCAGRCIGYDLQNFSIYYDTLNKLTGFDVEFYQNPYNMFTHSINNSPSADIIVSSAIMCHLSDPLHYLAFLGSITKKALLLFTAVDDTENYQITYDGAKKYYPELLFPNCFDEMTHISKGILTFGLKELGFTDIIEIPYSDSWIPYNNFQKFKAILAVK